MSKPTGRPKGSGKYTEEIAAEICERLAGGSSLRSICIQMSIELRTVMNWLNAQPAFFQQYTRAREIWADAEFEGMMQIADTPQEGEKTKTLPNGDVEVTTGDMIEHRRLQVDTRKWALARMAPKRFGDKLQTQLTGADGGPVQVATRVLLPTFDEIPRAEAPPPPKELED